MINKVQKKYWVEIYFDAEDVGDPSQIGIIKQGLWKIVVWELDKNNDVLLDSGNIKMNKLVLSVALIKAEKIKDKIKKNGSICYISRRNPKCRFPIKSAAYEFIGYGFRVAE